MSHWKFRMAISAALLGAAALASAQNADTNTATPTKNDLQLRVTEPREGETIQGSTVRLTLQYDTDYFGKGEGTRFSPRFPAPVFDVYLDNDLKQQMREKGQNVSVIENVPPGPHDLVVVAKNISGEIIDRKEIHVVNVAEVASNETAPLRAPASNPPAKRIAPAAPDASSVSAAAPAPAPAPKSARQRLPKTASPYPAYAVSGLALIAAGLVIGRRKSS